MRLLQKYILGELIRVFVLVVSALTVLLVFVGAFSQASENGLGPYEVLQILPYLVPSLLPFTIPATMLLTVTVVYGRIAADQEVTAAKAAGISALSLLWPSFVMGIALSLVSLLLTDQVIPWAMTNIQHRVAQMMEKIFLDMLGSRKLYINKSPSMIITVQDVQGKKLIKPVFRYRPTAGGDPISLQADEGSLRFDLQKRVVHLNFVNGRGEVPQSQSFQLKRQDYDFPIPENKTELRARQQSIRELRKSLDARMTALTEHRTQRDLETTFALATGDFERLAAPEVLQYAHDVQDKQEEMDKDRTEIHSRFALSASCFFFALIGGPFATLQARRQVLTSFFICFMPILILYYPVALLMMNQSKSGVVNPAWAMWCGNGLLLVIGWSILRKVLKH
jgi:lipopolysaccharide export system permease protein